MLRRNVGTDVEHQNLDGADGGLDLLHQCHHFFLLAGIAAEGMGFAACRFDLCNQWHQLVGIAPRHAGRVAFACEASGNGPAGRVACADNQAHALVGYSVRKHYFLRLNAWRLFSNRSLAVFDTA